MPRAFLLGLALLLSGQAPAAPTLPDVNGRAWPLLSPPRGTTHLVVFVSTDCPISNRYAPELGRIAAEYRDRQVRLFLVYEDPAVEADRVRQHLSEFYPGVDVPAFIDRGHVIAGAMGAKVTPTALIQTADGRPYRGRIDDLYLALGRTRREPTERTLRLSLDAVLAGRKPPAAVTESIGCYIGGIK